MAERARSLRKNLSKSKADQTKKPLPNQSSQPPSSAQEIDPLEFLEKNNNAPTMNEELGIIYFNPIREAKNLKRIREYY